MKPWNSDAITGCHRFLKRCWTLVTQNAHEGCRQFCAPEQEELLVLKALHRTIKKVTENTEGLRYNTAIAAMMEFINDVGGLPISKKTAESLSLMLSPYAPHITEELWTRLGNESSIARVSWPAVDEQYLIESSVTVVIQVQGKKRATIEAPVAIDDGPLKELVVASMAETPYAVTAEKKIVIVRDRVTGSPKLVNVV
jgi:leucyl-tRNA synthetase